MIRTDTDYPGSYMNEEWWGLFGVEPGCDPDRRIPRLAYFQARVPEKSFVYIPAHQAHPLPPTTSSAQHLGAERISAHMGVIRICCSYAQP